MENKCTLQTQFAGFWTVLPGPPRIVRFWIGIKFSVTGPGRSGTFGDGDVDLAESVRLFGILRRSLVMENAVCRMENAVSIWKISVAYGIFGFHMENKRSVMENAVYLWKIRGLMEKKAIFMENKK